MTSSRSHFFIFSRHICYFSVTFNIKNRSKVSLGTRVPLDVLRDVIYWRDEQHSRVDTRAWIRQQWWAMEWEDSRMSQHDTTKLEWATRTTNSWLTSSGWNFHNSGILWHQEINNHEFIMTNEIFIEFAMVLAHNKKQIAVMRQFNSIFPSQQLKSHWCR